MLKAQGKSQKHSTSNIYGQVQTWKRQPGFGLKFCGVLYNLCCQQYSQPPVTKEHHYCTTKFLQQKSGASPFVTKHSNVVHDQNLCHIRKKEKKHNGDFKRCFINLRCSVWWNILRKGFFPITLLTSFLLRKWNLTVDFKTWYQQLNELCKANSAISGLGWHGLMSPIPSICSRLNSIASFLCSFKSISRSGQINNLSHLFAFPPCHQKDCMCVNVLISHRQFFAAQGKIMIRPKNSSSESKWKLKRCSNSYLHTMTIDILPTDTTPNESENKPTRCDWSVDYQH